MYINIKIEYLIIRTGLTYGAGVVHLTLLSVDQLEVDLLQGRGHPLRAQVRAVREAGSLPHSSWAAVPDSPRSLPCLTNRSYQFCLQKILESFKKYFPETIMNRSDEVPIPTALRLLLPIPYSISLTFAAFCSARLAVFSRPSSPRHGRWRYGASAGVDREVATDLHGTELVMLAGRVGQEVVPAHAVEAHHAAVLRHLGPVDGIWHSAAMLYYAVAMLLLDFFLRNPSRFFLSSLITMPPLFPSSILNIWNIISLPSDQSHIK